MSTKICTVCEQSMPLDRFYNSAKSKDGKSYRCKSCDDLARRKWRKENLESARSSQRYRNIKCKYGLTKEDFHDLLEKQGGKCPICLNHLNHGWSRKHDPKKAVVDHCHDTGKVRGILCTMCNKGIGLLKDDKNIALRAYKYLDSETH